MQTVAEHRCCGGVQGMYRHASAATGTDMEFAVFVPDAGRHARLPVLWWLSGLTCSAENFTCKAGAQRYASAAGLILVAPDTSPRGAAVPGEDDDYDFGAGAGFYVDATNPPWDRNYRMRSYITRELPQQVFDRFPGDESRQGITGHSMGGHGALTIGLSNPGTYQSISAFAPICSPRRCPWGQKALSGYLGYDREAWARYDAVDLVRDGCRSGEILVDQGDADECLATQLQPALLAQACEQGGQALKLRMQSGYDHSYFFIATFIGEHIRFHRDRL